MIVKLTVSEVAKTLLTIKRVGLQHLLLRPSKGATVNKILIRFPIVNGNMLEKAASW